MHKVREKRAKKIENKQRLSPGLERSTTAAKTSLVIMLKDRHCMQLESCQYLLFTSPGHARQWKIRAVGIEKARFLDLKFSLSKLRRRRRRFGSRSTTPDGM